MRNHVPALTFAMVMLKNAINKNLKTRSVLNNLEICSPVKPKKNNLNNKKLSPEMIMYCLSKIKIYCSSPQKFLPASKNSSVSVVLIS